MDNRLIFLSRLATFDDGVTQKDKGATRWMVVAQRKLEIVKREALETSRALCHFIVGWQGDVVRGSQDLGLHPNVGWRALWYGVGQNEFVVPEKAGLDGRAETR